MQPTKGKIFTTSPMTLTTPNSPSYDSHSSSSPTIRASFDRGYNSNGYNQETAFIGQQRAGESLSGTYGLSTGSTTDVRQLSWWRAGVRKALMNGLVYESRILGAMQVCRTRPQWLNYPPYFFLTGEDQNASA